MMRRGAAPILRLSPFPGEDGLHVWSFVDSSRGGPHPARVGTTPHTGAGQDPTRVGRVLERYLGPAQASVRTGAFGKPGIAGRHSDLLFFSRSRSCGAEAVAVSRSGLLGLDLQCIGCMPIGHRQSTLWLTEDEATQVDDFPSADRRHRLAELWTGKEAVVKALGTGLRMDPLRVQLAGQDRVAIDGRPDPRWWLRSVDLTAGLLLTVAVRRRSADRRVSPEWLSCSADIDMETCT